MNIITISDNKSQSYKYQKPEVEVLYQTLIQNEKRENSIPTHL